MARKSIKSNKKPPAKPAKRVRGPYQKAYVKVAVPPEVARWQRGGAQYVPYRQITQERACEITGKSIHTVRRWASGRHEIDVTSLRLLQIWTWGIIPGQEFIDAGIFLIYDSWRYVTPGKGRKPETLIATDNGYFIKASDLQSFGWLQGYYQDGVRRLNAEKAKMEEAAKPRAQIIPFMEHYLRRHGRKEDSDKDQA